MVPGLSLAAIAVGAALGALLRWGLSLWLNARLESLPIGTLLANLIGGYLIGIAVGVFENLDRKSTRLNSSHSQQSRMPSSA